MRTDFTVAQDGTVMAETPEQILPRPGEGPAAGDLDFYFTPDLWGGPTSDMLYLTVSHIEERVSTTGELVESFTIYDMNDMSQAREVFREVDGVGNWDCPMVPNPQYVPTCYNLYNARFNPSGTRIYFAEISNDDQGERWNAVLRFDVDMNGALANWTIGDPQIVVTAPSSEDGPFWGAPRPASDRMMLPAPEIIASSVYVGSSTNVSEARVFLDANQCAMLYEPFSDGNSSGQTDLWMQCLDSQLLGGEEFQGWVGGWQSPDTVLNVYPPENPAIYRFHVSGAMAGMEELLIENGEFPDTGL